MRKGPAGGDNEAFHVVGWRALGAKVDGADSAQPNMASGRDDGGARDGSEMLPFGNGLIVNVAIKVKSEASKLVRILL